MTNSDECATPRRRRCRFDLRAALEGPALHLVEPRLLRRERIEQAKEDWKTGRFAPVPGDPEFIPPPKGWSVVSTRTQGSRSAPIPVAKTSDQRNQRAQSRRRLVEPPAFLQGERHRLEPQRRSPLSAPGRGGMPSDLSRS